MIDLFEPPQKPSTVPSCPSHRNSVMDMEGVVHHHEEVGDQLHQHDDGAGAATAGDEDPTNTSNNIMAAATPEDNDNSESHDHEVEKPNARSFLDFANMAGDCDGDDCDCDPAPIDFRGRIDRCYEPPDENEYEMCRSYHDFGTYGQRQNSTPPPPPSQQYQPQSSLNQNQQLPYFNCPGFGIGPQIASVPPNWIELASRVFHGDQQELASDGKLTEKQMRDFYNYSMGVGHEGFDGRLLSETFLSTGRINHAIQIMAYHADYLEVFLRAHHFLLRGDGPLPYTFRHYIAIMAAARFQCSYLMELQKREFLLQGGDPKWLQGLEAAPKKLTSLYHINKMMAHRPWVLKKEDFLYLTKKAGWSLSEVVQAVVLLAHFHSLSSFIHGCGITHEIDFDKGHSYLDPVTFNDYVIGSSSTLSSPGHQSLDGQVMGALSGNNNNDSTSSPSPSPGGGAAGGSGEGSGNNKAINKTDMASNSPICGSPISSHLNNNKSGLLRTATHHMNSQSPTPESASGIGISSPSLATSPPKKTTSEVEIIMATMKNLSETVPIEDPEERKKRFETVASSDDSHEKENRLTPGSIILSALPPDVSPFLSDPEFTYEDFAKRGQLAELHTFRIQDYCWEEHGFSLVNRLYADVGSYLDDKFKVAQNMTYYTMGDRCRVDTTKFRTAVWNYIQCLYGIRHDDYDYGEVNQLLERPLKSYIKTVCCYPPKITQADYDNVMKEFKHSEKVHVNLLIMEAKIQAELLYGLRTIMKFIL